MVTDRINPFILELDVVQAKGGNLSYLQPPQLPFDIKRAYWIYDLEEGARRGGHSHKNTDRVLLCIQGSIEVVLENQDGKYFKFALENPSQALFFPKNHWIDIYCSEKAVLLTLASTSFEEDVQENDYKRFQKGG